MPRIVHPLLDDAAWLRTRYVTEGRTLKQIAAETGVSGWTVLERLIEHGIPRRPPGGRTRPPDEVDEYIHRRYVGERAHGTTIAAELGRTKSFVYGRLEKAGIKRRPAIDADWLRRSYVQEGRSIHWLAREARTTRDTIKRWLDRLGIRRSRRG
jgi:hypothetical protein